MYSTCIDVCRYEYLYSACTMKHVHVINHICLYNKCFHRLLQISSFSGKMNALNEVHVYVHVSVCTCVCVHVCVYVHVYVHVHVYVLVHHCNMSVYMYMYVTDVSLSSSDKQDYTDKYYISSTL